MTREQFIQLVSDEQEALRGFLLALCCGYKDDADDIAVGIIFHFDTVGQNRVMNLRVFRIAQNAVCNNNLLRLRFTLQFKIQPVEIGKYFPRALGDHLFGHPLGTNG